jgi:LAO/AO transport system kinase
MAINKEQIIKGIARGDIRMLSKAITLAESTLHEQRNIALEVIEHFGPQQNTLRVGITGTPGAGKSTLIETLGISILKDEDRKVAVLSIDPSSGKTKGSILGDKTRMNQLSSHPRAYIRPTASGSQLGGLAKNTRLAMLLCEAAGFNTVLIESVGVGQGETEIAQLADMFVLVLNPGGGDELQGIKRGIMEEADLIVINKADGDAEKQAKLTAKEYSMALHLMPKTESEWKAKVITVSALEHTGISVLWNHVVEFEQHTIANDWKMINRKAQMKYWAKKTVQELLLAQIENFENDISKGLAAGQLPERIAHLLIK